VETLGPNEKGAIAEARIAATAILAGVFGYDLAFDFGDRIDRVQCKWGRLLGDVIAVRTSTSRHSPTRGYVRTTYRAGEVDAFGIYCGDLDRCYYLPAALVVGKTFIHLRLAAARNNQRIGVTMAADFEFGAVAQLGERRHGMAEVRGSSPLSSM
jgi:hypothetical protein